jgi:hypothetical protein
VYKVHRDARTESQIEPTPGSRQLTISRSPGEDVATFGGVDSIVVLARTRAFLSGAHLTSRLGITERAR